MRRWIRRSGTEMSMDPDGIGSFSRSREKAGDEGKRAENPHPSPLPQAGEGTRQVLLEKAVAGRSPWADARARFMRNKAAVVSLITLMVIALACIVGPFVLPYDFETA